MLEITDTLAPKSDQLNADDLRSGPRTFTIDRVRIPGGDQPVEVFLAEWEQPYKPCKTMRRVMTELWGGKSADYTGRQFTLYRDPKVRFGADTLGGIRISHMSHIGDEKRKVSVPVKKGQRGYWTVEPLSDAAPSTPAPSETDAQIAALQAEWHTADDDRKAAIVAEVDALRAQ